MTEGNPLGREEPAPRADNQDPALFGHTPWQTVGPFFHYGLPWKGGADLVGGSDIGADWGARPDLFDAAHWVLHLAPPRGPVAGEPIELFGRVLDADGLPVTDALVEIWQANAAGRYASPDDGREDLPLDAGFTGFGRAAVDAEGEYRFRTVRPGRTPAPGGGLQAPHVAVGVLGRGLLRRLVTRLYLDDGDGLAEDPILALVPQARRGTLVAKREAGGYRLDIRLAGAGETVFFEF